MKIKVILGLIIVLVFSPIVATGCFGTPSQIPISSSTPATPIPSPTPILDATKSPINTILSAPGTSIETDYYRSLVNPNGTLEFVNKITGEMIMDNAPSYHFNYGNNMISNVSSLNSSFESSNVDGIPDGWAVDYNYIRTSKDYASAGNQSLMFNMTFPDKDNRTAYSSLMPITQDSTYSISVDSLVSNYESGSSTLYIAYYDTANGTRTQYLSLQLMQFSNYYWILAHIPCQLGTSLGCTIV